MSDLEEALKGLGVSLDSSQTRDYITNNGQVAFSPIIPSLSGFSEFTPITVRSYTTSNRAHDADVEPN